MKSETPISMIPESSIPTSRDGLTGRSNLRVDFPDQDLAKRLQCHLNSIVQRDHIHVSAGRNLDISVHDGCVVISGQVASDRERDLVSNCCRRVAGVIQLDDQDLKSSN